MEDKFGSNATYAEHVTDRKTELGEPVQVQELPAFLPNSLYDDNSDFSENIEHLAMYFFLCK